MDILRVSCNAAACTLPTEIHRLVIDNHHVLYDPENHLLAEKAGFRMVK